jgi:DNA-binding transcriptional LysR family regulator
VDFNLDCLRTFIVVARTGTLSAAARELGTTQPSLGRQMTALEKAVNLVLFVRHPRGLGLTKQGQEFLDLCQDIVGRLAQETGVIRERCLEPEGNLHFLSGFGVLESILENIHLFSENYPKFSFNFSTNINVYQLQIGNADVVVTPDVSSSDPDFIQRPLYDTAMRVYASPQYLKLHSVPKILEDLQSHRVIVYVGEKQEVLNKPIMGKNMKNLLHPFIELTSGPLMRTALINGAGIGCYAYNRDIMEKDLLVDVFPDLPDHIVSYYFTYHKRLEGSPKIEVFYEFLKEITKVWEWRDKEGL